MEFKTLMFVIQVCLLMVYFSVRDQGVYVEHIPQ